jgi:hypothetical protein
VEAEQRQSGSGRMTTAGPAITQSSPSVSRRRTSPPSPREGLLRPSLPSLSSAATVIMCGGAKNATFYAIYI